MGKSAGLIWCGVCAAGDGDVERKEERVLNLLAEAWGEFLSLAQLHEWHQREFMSAIHEAQRLVLSRGGIKMQIAKELLERLTELVPPGPGQRHNLTIQNGQLEITLMTGDRYQSFLFEDGDYARSVEDAARAIADLYKKTQVATVDPSPEPVDETHLGLHAKYRVERLDGRSAPGEKHHGCYYFVLDVDHDPYAVPALQAYVDACGIDYPKLALDLLDLLDNYR